ncbi:isochorismatase family protein [Bradyrhizobium sp. ORS 86]|uniref:isochorismatase family protein n=1 Tax=Bradyrhizobium sp. ORS 86 TaxID=1685970 RepID=UPI00388D2891
MLTIDPRISLLLIVDFQSRLMPAIHEGAAAVRNARRLLDMAELTNVPAVFTEQNAKGLGATVTELAVSGARLIHKMTFDAVREPEFLKAVAPDRHVVVAGCEAHVCVQQTVLGLIDARRKVYVVRDALGSRYPEDKETAIRRMERHGAEIVTTEMVMFEWLETAEHPRFREAIALIK